MIYQIDVNHPFWQGDDTLKDVLYFTQNKRVYRIINKEIKESSWDKKILNQFIAMGIVIPTVDLDNKLLELL